MGHLIYVKLGRVSSGILQVNPGGLQGNQYQLKAQIDRQLGWKQGWVDYFWYRSRVRMV